MVDRVCYAERQLCYQLDEECALESQDLAESVRTNCHKNAADIEGINAQLSVMEHSDGAFSLSGGSQDSKEAIEEGDDDLRSVSSVTEDSFYDGTHDEEAAAVLEASASIGRYRLPNWVSGNSQPSERSGERPSRPAAA